MEELMTGKKRKVVYTIRAGNFDGVDLGTALFAGAVGSVMAAAGTLRNRFVMCIGRDGVPGRRRRNLRTL